MNIAQPDTDRKCTFKQYTSAYRIGTGLKVSLPPGEYSITGEEFLDGVLYFRLNETYRIDSGEMPAE